MLIFYGFHIVGVKDFESLVGAFISLWVEKYFKSYSMEI